MTALASVQTQDERTLGQGQTWRQSMKDETAAVQVPVVGFLVVLSFVEEEDEKGNINEVDNCKSVMFARIDPL